MLFQEIIGQEEIKRKLIQVVREQRVGHALLFAGPEGTGKLALALACARFMNCEDPRGNDSCRECSSCRKYAKLVHPDLHFVFPVAKKDNSSKETVCDDFLTLWRESLLANPYMSLFQWYEHLGVENRQGIIKESESRQIIRKLSFRNFEAAFKVMVIWMAEKMNIVAANKLMKILEEPPPHTVFMLVAEDTAGILPTILSRTQLIRIPKIDSAAMHRALKDIYGIGDGKRAEGIVRMADGNYLRLLEAVTGNDEAGYNFQMFVRLMRVCYMPDIPGISLWIEEMAPRGRERQKQFLDQALRLVRGNFIMNVEAGNIDLLSDDEKDWSAKFSKFVHQGNVFRLCDELGRASLHIEYNGYARLVFFDLALKIARLLKT